MENIPSVEQFISNVVNQSVVRPTGAPNIGGVGGFLFDILENEEAGLDSDITDHYVEDNYAIQDHIAIRPLMFTLRGYIGELNNILPQVALGVLTNIQSLASIGSFMPKFSAQATQTYLKIQSVTAQANAVINQANNIFDIFKDKNTTATKQQEAYKFFFGLWQARQLCTVETPFDKFENMAIMSCRIIQRGETRLYSDFSVTFKQIRTASTILAMQATPAPLASGRARYASADVISSGQITGKNSNLTAVSVLKTYYPGTN